MARETGGPDTEEAWCLGSFSSDQFLTYWDMDMNQSHWDWGERWSLVQALQNYSRNAAQLKSEKYPEAGRVCIEQSDYKELNVSLR